MLDKEIEEIIIDEEKYESIKKEYEEIKGISPEEEKITGTGNKTELSDETFEAMITDPNLILRDFRCLCDKHGISAVDLLKKMGFNLPTLKSVIYKKSITEQIYILNRELSLIIYAMGVESGTVKDGFETVNIRTLLGDVTSSKEWLHLLDKQILPYISYFKENGKIDKDWFLSEDNELEYVTDFNMVKPVITQIIELGKEIDDEFGEISKLDLDNIDNITLEHGEKSVIETTEEELNKVKDSILDKEQPSID